MNRRRDSRRSRWRRCPCPRSGGSSPPSCRCRRGRRGGPPPSPSPRTRSEGPGCWRERCCAALMGTPMRMTERANSWLALAEPDPFTLAKLDDEIIHGVCDAASVPRMCHLDEGFLHVPGARRAALGTHPAVKADVLVLDHDAAGLQPVLEVERLIVIPRRSVEPAPQVLLLAVPGEGDAVHRAYVDAGVALDAELRRRTPSGRRS